ncbi:MAG: high-potential iron-sulfur protein [Pseudomonadota bacterium]
MSKLSRRQFNKTLGQGLLAVPAALVVAQLPSRADSDMALVDPESAIAKQLQYAVASENDAKCSTCALYTGIDDEIGKFTIFPANVVPAEAWCSAFAPKPS